MASIISTISASIIISRMEMPVIGRGEAYQTTVTFPSGWSVVQHEDWLMLDYEGNIRKEVKTPDGEVIFVRTEYFGHCANDGMDEFGYECQNCGSLLAEPLLRWAATHSPEYIKGEKPF